MEQKDSMYMNKHTGSVDTKDGWISDDFSAAQVEAAISEGSLVELEPGTRCTVDGVTVYLTQYPYPSAVEGYYEAGAVDRTGDAHEVYWTVAHPGDDEEVICEWDKPVAIKRSGCVQWYGQVLY